MRVIDVRIGQLLLLQHLIKKVLLHLILVYKNFYLNNFIELFDSILVLRQRQTYGLIDKSTVILTVNDPQDKLGSGGATLNALLVAVEYLSAKAGYSVSLTIRV